VPGLRCTQPGGRVDQMGEVNRLIPLGIGEAGRVDATQLELGLDRLACQEPESAPMFRLGFNSVSALSDRG